MPERPLSRVQREAIEGQAGDTQAPEPAAMSEDPEPYGTRPPDLHTWTLRLEDGTEVTLDAPSIRKAVELCQRRQLLRKIGTRAPIIAATRQD